MFFLFFFFPGFNLLAKEKNMKNENKSHFFLKKLQGNEDYYAKFY